MKKKCKNCFGIGLYVFYSLLGNYLLTAGLIGDWNVLNVLKNPIFWGIALILISLFHGTKLVLSKK